MSYTDLIVTRQQTWLAGTPLYPILLDTKAEHCQLHLQGWRTTTGLLLQQPITLSQHLTPAFAK